MIKLIFHGGGFKLMPTFNHVVHYEP